eukprot:UN08180
MQIMLSRCLGLIQVGKVGMIGQMMICHLVMTIFKKDYNCIIINKQLTSSINNIKHFFPLSSFRL